MPLAPSATHPVHRLRSVYRAASIHGGRWIRFDRYVVTRVVVERAGEILETV